MTSKISLFNSGIYKNTLHRFKWGSLLYFIALFFSTSFLFLTESPAKWVERYEGYNGFPQGTILLDTTLMIIPTLLAFAVPTVVAVLVFGGVRSARQGVFIHSLPVTRGAGFVSTVLAAFTLMLAPVLANGIVLLAISAFGYGATVKAWTVVYWVAVNAAILFIMFSAASFSAFLTGNGIAHVVVNVLLHTVSVLVALVIFLVSDVFLFGFTASDGFAANTIIAYTPIVRLFELCLNNGYYGVIKLFKGISVWVYLVGSLVLYVLAYLLYSRRKIEKCGDVAAFDVFRPILKYTVSAGTAAAMFGILVAMNLNSAAVFIITAIICAVVYFGCEMLLSKTVKVFGSYKGYAAFAASVGLVIVFCAFTSVFGYETHIPRMEEIESATVYGGYCNTVPFTDDSGAIALVRELHKDFIADIPVTTGDDYFEGFEDTHYLRVEYRLKNGKAVRRRYPMSGEKAEDALTKIYEYSDYKLKVTGLEPINVENVTHLTLNVYSNGFDYYASLNDGAAELLQNVKKDIEALSYGELENASYGMVFNISFDVTAKENRTLKIFDESVFGENASDDWVQSFNIGINPNFKNTMAFLKSEGLLDEIISQAAKNVKICTIPIYQAGNICRFKDDTGEFWEFLANPDDCAALDGGDARRFIEEFINDEYDNKQAPKDGKNYLVFGDIRGGDGNLSFTENLRCYTEAELPAYLKGYVKE